MWLCAFVCFCHSDTFVSVSFLLFSKTRGAKTLGVGGLADSGEGYSCVLVGESDSVCSGQEGGFLHLITLMSRARTAGGCRRFPPMRLPIAIEFGAQEHKNASTARAMSDARKESRIRKQSASYVFTIEYASCSRALTRHGAIVRCHAEYHCEVPNKKKYKRKRTKGHEYEGRGGRNQSR